MEKLYQPSFHIALAEQGCLSPIGLEIVLSALVLSAALQPRLCALGNIELSASLMLDWTLPANLGA